MNWKAWLKAAGVRSVKTVAQTAIATIGTAAAIGQVDWKFVLSASLLAGFLSILTSIAGIPEANGGASPLDSSTPPDVGDYKG